MELHISHFIGLSLVVSKNGENHMPSCFSLGRGPNGFFLLRQNFRRSDVGTGTGCARANLVLPEGIKDDENKGSTASNKI